MLSTAPALLYELAGYEDGVIQAAHHDERFGAARFGFRHLHREVARRGVVRDRVHHLVGHGELRHHASEALLHRHAEGVVHVHEDAALRRRAGAREHLELVGERVAEDHRRGREVAEHELVALLGDRRRGGDVDDERDAALLGDLGDRRGLAGVERADEELRAFADQALRARAGDVDVRLGIAVHEVERRQAEILQHARCDLNAAVAVLADAGLHARARQQHADLQAARLRAHDPDGVDKGNRSYSGKRLAELPAFHDSSSSMSGIVI
jgi:hypothetical protein